MLVVAKYLPLSLLPECLGLTDNVEYELREKINAIMSSILPVYDDCLTVYHKSLHDWLTSDGYKEHAFTVDSQSGHEYLWSACEKVFCQIYSATTLFSVKSSPSTMYALAHEIFHMTQCRNISSYHWSVDVKIVYFRIMVQPERAYNMRGEWQKIVKNSGSRLSKEVLWELNWHIRFFDLIFDVFEFKYENLSRYLQFVANRINCTDEKRFLSKSLLKQRHYFWFEDLDATNLKQRCHKSVPLRTDVTCIGVSSNEQLVAVGYIDGWISIFRVPGFQEVHTFDTMTDSDVFRSGEYFQDSSMLFYDRYDYFPHMPTETDSMVFGGDCGALWSCSFSPSGNRLVSCDGSEKIKLWDVNSKRLLVQLQAGGPVDCCSFSECGLFIVASKVLGRKYDGSANHTDVFTLWNVLTKQRVDRRSVPAFRQRVKRNDGIGESQLLMSRNGTGIDVFQIPNSLLVDRLNRYIFPFLLPVTRHHWRNCTLHHTNESIKFTDERQLLNFRKGFVRNWSPLSFNGCPCSYTKATRLGPVKVQRLYVVPFFSKLDVFSIVQQPSLSIQPLPVQEIYSVSCCCFSPDGCFLATCANGVPLSILIWDTKLCIIVQFLRLQLVRAERCCGQKVCFGYMMAVS